MSKKRRATASLSQPRLKLSQTEKESVRQTEKVGELSTEVLTSSSLVQLTKILEFHTFQLGVLSGRLFARASSRITDPAARKHVTTVKCGETVSGCFSTLANNEE